MTCKFTIKQLVLGIQHQKDQIKPNSNEHVQLTTGQQRLNPNLQNYVTLTTTSRVLSDYLDNSVYKMQDSRRT